MGIAPLFLGNVRLEFLLDLVHRLRTGQAQSLGDPEDMGVHRDRGDAEGIGENHVGGFSADARERRQRLARGRDFSPVPLEKQAGRPHQGASLVSIKAEPIDIGIKFFRRTRRH